MGHDILSKSLVQWAKAHCRAGTQLGLCCCTQETKQLSLSSPLSTKYKALSTKTYLIN